MILQTLYQQCIKAGVKFYDEYHVVDLVTEGGELGDGRPGGRAWSPTGSPTASSSRPARQGRAARDRRLRPHVPDHLERLQPDRRRRGAGLPPRRPDAGHGVLPVPSRPASCGIGILLSEAARGEGAYLLNNDGVRFMERYAPKLMELAPRDMVSRAIYQEIRAGRGIDGKDYVYLDVRHLGRKMIDEKLPDITDFVRVYLGVEPLHGPDPDPADRALRHGRRPDRPR